MRDRDYIEPENERPKFAAAIYPNGEITIVPRPRPNVNGDSEKFWGWPYDHIGDANEMVCDISKSGLDKWEAEAKARVMAAVDAKIIDKPYKLPVHLWTQYELMNLDFLLENEVYQTDIEFAYPYLSISHTHTYVFISGIEFTIGMPFLHWRSVIYGKLPYAKRSWISEQQIEAERILYNNLAEMFLSKYFR